MYYDLVNPLDCDWSHVERGQFALPHFYCADLVL